MTGFVIADLTVTDSEMFDEYKSKVGSTIEKYNGKVTIMASKAKEGSISNIEGDWNPNLFVVIQFESVDQAKKWYNSPEYTDIIDLRFKSSITKLNIVEGM